MPADQIETPNGFKIGIRCCGFNGGNVVSVCQSGGPFGSGGSNRVQPITGVNGIGTWAQDEAECTAQGMRQCTVDELDDGQGAGTGCEHDNRYIWTSDQCTPLPVAYPADLNAWYCPGAFDLASGTWHDCSGNGNTATLSGSGLNESRSAGHGAANEVLALSGTTSSVVAFGPVIKSSFTLCSVTRYTGGTMLRVLTGGVHWLHGHLYGEAGAAYYGADGLDGTKTVRPGVISPNTDWLVMCGTNSAETQLMLANGLDVGTHSGGVGNVSLFVNAGGYPPWGAPGGNHASDFAIAEVVVWPRGLTSEELHHASNHIMHRMGLRPAAYPADLNAWYCPGAFDLASGTWHDCSGNGNTATLSGSGLAELRGAGHGAANEVLALSGNTSSVIDFGAVIKTNFTVCSATRYTGGTKGRILQGSGSNWGPANWLHGHHDGKAGVAFYYDGWKTSLSYYLNEGNVVPNTDWVVMCGTNAGSQLMLANGDDIGTAGQWVRYRNRHATMGGVGATAHYSVPPSQLPVESLEDCQALCWATAGCNAIVWKFTLTSDGDTRCWLRAVTTPVDESPFPGGYGHYDLYVYVPFEHLAGTADPPGVSLFVNGGSFPMQKSDFAIAELVVWPRGLTSEEMHHASEYLMNRMSISSDDGESGSG